jgi:hypothetical protein
MPLPEASSSSSVVVPEPTPMVVECSCFPVLVVGALSASEG